MARTTTKKELNNMEELNDNVVIDTTNSKELKKEQQSVEYTVTHKSIESKDEVSNVDLLLVKKREVEDLQNSNSEFNPLKNETIIVRYIPNNKFPNPKHVFHGGLSDKATVDYCVPSLENGTLKNPLTNSEKIFFEEFLGLEKNALSVYNKKNNFWLTSNPNGIGYVSLKKQDNYFNLSNPTDWLKVRILTMHPDDIALSYKDIQENPANNYRFVIVHDASESELKKNKQYYTKESWKLLGKIEENKWAMKYIIEKLESRPIASSTKLEVLSTRCGDLIEENAVKFYSIITDEYFDTKVMMSKCIEEGILNRRNGFYYTKQGEPLCDANQNSTEEIAAKFLNKPKNQDLLFLLQDKVNNI